MVNWGRPIRGWRQARTVIHESSLPKIGERCEDSLRDEGGFVCVCVCVCVCVRACTSTQLCPTLCHPVYYSPSGSSVRGISQTGILDWAAISFSRGSFQPRDRTRISCPSCIGRQILYHWAPWESWWFLSRWESENTSDVGQHKQYEVASHTHTHTHTHPYAHMSGLVLTVFPDASSFQLWLISH